MGNEGIGEACLLFVGNLVVNARVALVTIIISIVRV